MAQFFYTNKIRRDMVKVKVKRSHYRPGQAQRVQEVKVRRFHDNGTGW